MRAFFLMVLITLNTLFISAFIGFQESNTNTLTSFVDPSKPVPPPVTVAFLDPSKPVPPPVVVAFVDPSKPVPPPVAAA